MGAAKKLPTARTENDDHGRIDTRRAVVVPAGVLGVHHEFAGLTAIGMIESTRSIDGISQTFVHYFAPSRRFKPAELLRMQSCCASSASIRWHWQLDVELDEDMSRTRKDSGPENLGLLRRLALNIARADNTRGSLAGKLRKCAWNDDALVASTVKCDSPGPPRSRCRAQPDALSAR